MIAFPCTNCGEPLSVPDDMAGDEIQCPNCKSLPTVPSLADLPHLQSDGTLGVAPLPMQHEPNRLATLARSFGRQHYDDEGNQIDNRGTVGSIDLSPMPAPPSLGVRFVPETGERVRPFAIKATPVAAANPTRHIPTVAYATPTNHPSLWMEMFAPHNVVVLFYVWIAHVIGIVMDGMLLILLAGVSVLGDISAIPTWPFNALFWLAVAHYANVVRATGTDEQDELPRPLRQLEYVEDIIKPCGRALLAFGLAYLPLLLVNLFLADDVRRVAAAATLVVGGLVFPAMLLCAAGSGTIINLRLDRVARTIKACGPHYWPLALLTTVIVPLYVWSATGSQLFSPIISGTKAVELLRQVVGKMPLLLLPLLTICVYAAHGICWQLGRLQREHKVHTHWAWEVHEAQRQEERRRREAERNRKASRT